MAEDFSKWPTKQEARMRLGGVPERSFDRWLSENNVKIAYVKVQGRRPVPVVDPNGLAVIQQKMMRPALALPTTLESTNVQMLPQIPPAWREMAATFAAQISPQPLFITLQEAVAYSGLSEDLLRQLVNKGTILGFPRQKGYKISRKSLDAFAESPGIIPPKNISPVARNGRKKK
jgi:hypothetical protein